MTAPSGKIKPPAKQQSLGRARQNVTIVVMKRRYHTEPTLPGLFVNLDGRILEE